MRIALYIYSVMNERKAAAQKPSELSGQPNTVHAVRRVGAYVLHVLSKFTITSSFG